MSIEIPGNLLAQLLLNRMKRRILLVVAFILAALSIIATQFIAKEYSWLVLLCFVIGKGAITIAFTTLSLYTAEQWPTNIRNTIMNTCSMIGRTGSMLAPFAAILVNWNLLRSTQSVPITRMLTSRLFCVYFRVLTLVHCPLLYSVDQPLLQPFRCCSIQRHIPKNCQIQLKKQNTYKQIFKYNSS